MSLSYPLAQLAAGSWQLSARNESGPSLPPTRHTPHATRHSRPCGAGAFTLIELLVVVAIIAILAALTLGTLGYVNRKGAESRARAEVAALSAAIDSYKLEFGSYPASNTLYGELVGDTNATGGAMVNTNGKTFFEPTGQIVDTNVTPRRFIDPWGSPYNYTTNATNNIGFFDLWTSNNATTNPGLWIRN
jgi:type II secretion system protein G